MGSDGFSLIKKMEWFTYFVIMNDELKDLCVYM